MLARLENVYDFNVWGYEKDGFTSRSFPMLYWNVYFWDHKDTVKSFNASFTPSHLRRFEWVVKLFKSEMGNVKNNEKRCANFQAWDVNLAEKPSFCEWKNSQPLFIVAAAHYKVKSKWDYLKKLGKFSSLWWKFVYVKSGYLTRKKNKNHMLNRDVISFKIQTFGASISRISRRILSFPSFPRNNFNCIAWSSTSSHPCVYNSAELKIDNRSISTIPSWIMKKVEIIKVESNVVHEGYIWGCLRKKEVSMLHPLEFLSEMSFRKSFLSSFPRYS